MSEDEAFIRAIVDRPGDDTARLVYADWLDDRGDPRAEFLRLTVQRDGLADGDPARIQAESRLAQLRAELDPQWLMVFDPAPVGNCPCIDPNCRWDDARPTDLPDIRICHRCWRSVIYCHALDEAREFASCGQVVALSTRIPREQIEQEPAFREPPPDDASEEFELTLEEFLDAEPPGAPVIPPTLERPRPWWKFW